MKRVTFLITLILLSLPVCYAQRNGKPQVDLKKKIADATPESLAPVPAGVRKSSDLKDDNIKGKAKSVLEYSIESGKRCVGKEDFFDEDGNRVKSVNYMDCYPDSVTVYGYLDGMLVNRSGDIEYKQGEKPPSKDMVLTMRAEDNSLDPSAHRDLRYSMRRSYDYDDQGRLTQWRVYQNNGEVWTSHVCRYEGDRRIVTDYDNAGQEISKTAETIGEDGDVAREDQYGPGDKVDSVVAFTYVRDKVGNWTEQRAFEVKKVRGREVLKPMWTSYRLITYYP